MNQLIAKLVTATKTLISTVPLWPAEAAEAAAEEVEAVVAEEVAIIDEFCGNILQLNLGQEVQFFILAINHII
jgi:hypothetical protein